MHFICSQIEKHEWVEKWEILQDLVKLMKGVIPNSTCYNSVTSLTLNIAVDSDTYTKKLDISKCSWIRVENATPSIVKTRTRFMELEERSSCKVLKKSVTINTIKDMDLSSVVLKQYIRLKEKRFLADAAIFKPFFEELIQ